MNGFVTLLVTALYALLLQNLVFTGGFGASEAVRISSKPRYVLSFALFITVFSAATSIICRALELLPQVSLAHTLVRLLIYMIVLFVLYVIVVLVFRYALHASDSILRKIGMAAFNTLVLAIPVINRSAAYTVGESLGAGLGAFTCWIVTIRSQRPFKERRRFLFMFLCWRLRSLVFPADPCLYNCRTVPEALCFYQ